MGGEAVVDTLVSVVVAQVRGIGEEIWQSCTV